MELSLYKLTDAQNQFMELGVSFDEETGELLFEDKGELELSIAEKAEAVACYRKNLAAKAAAIKAEIDTLSERMKRSQRAVESFDRYIANCVANTPDKAIETARVALRIKQCPPSVQVLDEASVPQEYLKEKVTVSVDKTKVKNAIKDGIEVPGCSLVRNTRLEVK